MRLLLAAALVVVACRPAAPPTATSDAAPRTVTIVAMNDFHGGLYATPDRKDPERRWGGLPWVAGALDVSRQERPELLVLDGGDVFQGAWPVNATAGMGAVRAYELLGVDAAAVGNHEFDYGGMADGHPLRGAFEAAAAAADFAWLSANVTHADGSAWGPEGVAPWKLLEASGVRVGVIVLTTTDTPSTTVLVFGDPVAAVARTVPEVRGAGAEVVAVVGHLTGGCDAAGFVEPGDVALPSGEIGRLLSELPRGTVDLIVAGHAHSLCALRWEDTFVLENRSGGRVLGRVDLVVGPDGVDLDASLVHPPWGLVHPPVDPGCDGGEYDLTARDIGGRSVTPSAEALALVRELEAEAGSLCDPVGCSARVLGRSRVEESELGNFAADAILAAFPGADLAIQNSGGLRADLPAGELRREHVQRVMPFENQLVLVELDGRRLELLLRLGSSGAHGIMQVAGGGYHFDPDRAGGDDLDGDGSVAPWEVDRLCSAHVGGAPIEPDRRYRVAVSDFLYAGGDDLGLALTGAPIVDEGGLLRDAIERHAGGEGCVGAGGPLLLPEAPRVRRAPCD